MLECIYSNSTFFKVFSFILGSFIGSFLNVCIYRIPYRKSILYPPSRCGLCLTPLKWYQNIPLFGFIFLRGRCAFCRQPFSIRYAVVEALSGIISLSLFIKTSDLYSYMVYLVFMGCIIVLSFIDIDHWLLPNRITVPFIVLGVLFSLFVPVTPAGYYIDLKSSLIGLLVGVSVLYLFGSITSKIMNKETMGGGDVKFMGLICTYLGWKAFLPVLLMAALQGSIYGVVQLVYYRFAKKKSVLDNNGVYSIFKDRSDLFTPTTHHIPFGPFLGLAAYEYLIWGTAIIHRIFGLNL